MLTVQGVRATFGTAALAGSGTLTAAGVRTALAAVGLTGAGTLTVAGVRTTFGAAALTGASALTVNGRVIPPDPPAPSSGGADDAYIIASRLALERQRRQPAPGRRRTVKAKLPPAVTMYGSARLACESWLIVTGEVDDTGSTVLDLVLAGVV